jgi:hypothetical protein
MPDQQKANVAMACTHMFHQVIKELFRPLFPTDTEEHKDAQYILVQFNCDDCKILGSDARPHEVLVVEPGVPVVGLPFVLNSPTPAEDARDYMLHVKGHEFLVSFWNVIDLLRVDGLKATFDSIGEEQKATFVHAAQAFAREYICFINQDPELALELIQECLPDAFDRYCEGDDDDQVRFLKIKAAFWALSGHSLTAMDLAALFRAKIRRTHA